MLNLVLGSFYAWSVFVLPLEQEFGWARSETSLTFSIGILTMAITFVFAGRLHATVGFRPLAAIGGVLFSIGFFLASFTSDSSSSSGAGSGSRSGFSVASFTSSSTIFGSD